VRNKLNRHYEMLGLHVGFLEVPLSQINQRTGREKNMIRNQK